MKERPRVRLSRQVLTNLPDPLTYVGQYWVPYRPTKVVSVNPYQVERDDTPWRRRIPNPYHTEYLTWMDRWSVTDFILLNGIRATTSGFVLTHP